MTPNQLRRRFAVTGTGLIFGTLLVGEVMSSDTAIDWVLHNFGVGEDARLIVSFAVPVLSAVVFFVPAFLVVRWYLKRNRPR